MMQNHLNNISSNSNTKQDGKNPGCGDWRAKWRNKIESGFYKLGYYVAQNPWKTIFISWIVVLILSLGLLKFYNEKDLMQLYVPKGHKFYRDTEWLINRYGVFEREQSVLITAPDVLVPEILHRALKVHEKIMSINVVYPNSTVVNFENLCYRIPIIAKLDLEDFSGDDGCYIVNSGSKQMCQALAILPSGCLQHSILEVFAFKHDRIPTSKAEIIKQILDAKVSPWSGMAKNFEELLGGIERDVNGTIVSAKSMLTFYKIYGNYSDIDEKRLNDDGGLGSWASEGMMHWEKEYLEQLEQIQGQFNDNSTRIFYQAYRSYGDKTTAVAFQEVEKYFAGIFLMFVFMQLVLSKFGWTEIRVGLGTLGLLSVGMGYLSGMGICSLLGIFYGPVHAALPFLLMGLGVDDIFVMMACWRQLQVTALENTLEERMAKMLQIAGASITITSITDITAFVVGGLAAMPILQSFCMYAAISILMMYLFVITFFVAVFTLDQRRVEQRRNGIFPCLRHDTMSAKIWFDKKLMDRSLEFVYSKLVLTPLGKTFIVLLTIALTTINTFGLVALKFRFDPTHYVPSDTYLSNYMHEINSLYPNMGSEASVLIGKINYTQDLPKLLQLSEQIKNHHDILYQIDAWPIDFNKFIDSHYKNESIANLTNEQWQTYLYQFLNCHMGGKYNQYFKFAAPFDCGGPATDVIVSQIGFKFKNLKDPEQYLPAKATLDTLVKNANLSSGEGFSTIWGKRLMMWVPDELVKSEIGRNIILALIGVMVCTALIIANANVCFWIFIMVILTLINVAGAMHHLGLILDMVTYIALQLSIGLCIDYAAHIGHMFLTIEAGTRNERALKTVTSIGAAVLYGGGSTFLALSVLSIAKTYSYRAFFMVNTLIIIFGLFHGVVLLPVILSIVGPKPTLRSPAQSQHANCNGNNGSLIHIKSHELEMFKNLSNKPDQKTNSKYHIPGDETMECMIKTNSL